MTAGRQRDGLATLPFFLPMAAVFTVYVGYGIVLPFLLERIVGEGARLSVAWHTGMIAGIYMLALFIGAPLWGRGSDRVGRRPVNPAGPWPVVWDWPRCRFRSFVA